MVVMCMFLIRTLIIIFLITYYETYGITIVKKHVDSEMQGLSKNLRKK